MLGKPLCVPAVRAHGERGRSLRRLDRLAESAEELDLAVRVGSTASPIGDRWILSFRFELALVRRELGELDRSSAELRALVPDMITVFGQDSAWMVAVVTQLASNVAASGDPGTAVDMVASLLPASSRHRGPMSPEALTLRSKAARWSLQDGARDRGMEAASRALVDFTRAGMSTCAEACRAAIRLRRVALRVRGGRLRNRPARLAARGPGIDDVGALVVRRCRGGGPGSLARVAPRGITGDLMRYISTMPMAMVLRGRAPAVVGVHRLADHWAARLVADAGVRAGDLVIDVGAGDGAVTRPLVARGARVVAVELHPGRAAALRRSFPGRTVRGRHGRRHRPAPAPAPLLRRRQPPVRRDHLVLRRLAAHGSQLEVADLVVPWHVARRWASAAAPGAHRWQRVFDASGGAASRAPAFIPPARGPVSVLVLRRASARCGVRAVRGRASGRAGEQAGHPRLDRVGVARQRAGEHRQPSAVTTTSSSMRTPIPRYCGGHREVVGLEVEPRLDREHEPDLERALVVGLVARVRAVVDVDAEHVRHAVQGVARVHGQLGAHRLVRADREDARGRRGPGRGPSSPRGAGRGTRRRGGPRRSRPAGRRARARRSRAAPR